MLRKMLRVILLFTLLLFLTTCETGYQKAGIKAYFNQNAPVDLTSTITHAEGFDIYHWEGITRVVVYDPRSRDLVIGEYFLTPREKASTFSSNVNLIVIPVDSVGVFSATQLNAFDKLGKLDRVVGISEAGYIINPLVRARLNRGEVVELATTGEFFVERTITLDPSLIFLSPDDVSEAHPLDVTGIPLVYFYDYYETDPLGRAEWLKFTAAFFDQEKKADSLFDVVATTYEGLKQRTAGLASRPTVFSDKYFNGQWFVPGGKSYIARLFQDAGATYLWENDGHTASFPLDFEVVYQKANDADYWRIIGSYSDQPSYKGLAMENELYRRFRAYREKKVIYCNARETAYFENSPLEPHIILADLINVFHPGLLHDYKPTYYKLLED